MDKIQGRNTLGRFIKGMVPHNKKWHGTCSVSGCDRTDMKALGLCQKHYKRKQSRERNGIFGSDLSKRLPRTEEHKRNNVKNRNPSNSLKGKTYKEIYGDRYEERIERHRKALIGVNKGKRSPLKGIKTGRAPWNKGISYCSKEKNPFWRGGSSREKYGHDFTFRIKEEIRDRDKRKCVLCGCLEANNKRKLCVHHIDENKLNNSGNNLISLCGLCHAKIHWGKDEWAKHLKDKLKNMEESICH